MVSGITAAASSPDPSGTLLPLQYVNPPGLPRGTTSFAVSEESWVTTIDRRVVPPARGTVAEQLKAALAELDRQLERDAARRQSIIRLDISYLSGGGTQHRRIEEILKSYFSIRNGSMIGVDGAIDYPITTLVGVRQLDAGGSSVIVNVRYVDRSSIPPDLLVDAKARQRAAGKRIVLFGGITGKAAGADHQISAAVANLKSVLVFAGTQLDSVAQLTAFIDDHQDVAAAEQSIKAAFRAEGAQSPAQLVIKPLVADNPDGTAVVLAGEARMVPVAR